ncbi:nitroreductase [Thalassococcus sp. BH17M4-6]|uniref:nitroreductase n=1 Tax=Thalassococcus sp. BH17M4-6 TaxID=3413148 RepID=UPI003BDEE6B4
MAVTLQEFQRLLEARYTCRGYLPEAVPRAKIEAVLRAAQHVPSWCNSQPWQVTVCGRDQTQALRTALLKHVQGGGDAGSDVPFPQAYEGIYKERRSICGWQLYGAVGVEKGDRAGSARQSMQNFHLFGAPHFMLVTTPKALGPYGVLDCGAFVTAVLLGLTAHGLAGAAMASVAGYAGFLRDWFDVDEDRDVLCGIAFGHPDADHPANSFRTARARLEEAAEWRWD